MRRSRLDPSGPSVLLIALMIGPALSAQDAKANIEKMAQDYAAAQTKWMNDYRAADRAGRTKLITSRPKPADWFPRFFAVIKSNPQSADAVTAASWIINNRAASGADFEKTIGVLRSYHVADAKMASVCGPLSFIPSQTASNFLRLLEAKNPNAKTKAMACYSLAVCLKRQASMARSLKAADEKRLASMVQFYGRETVDILKTAEPANLDKQAEDYFAKVVDTADYASQTYRRSSLGQTAKTNLFELRNLGIGKTAPQIEGEDIDGNELKLSDYRGKVVVLDFWGDW